MAIYHLEAKVVSRCVGLSAVAAAAYLSCSRLYNDYDGIQHDCSAELGLPYGYKTEPVSQTDIQDAVLALIRTYAQCAIAGEGRMLSKRLKEALNYRKGNVGHQELAAWVEGLGL